MGISGLPFGSPKTKRGHLDVGLVERRRVYYKGEGGGFLKVWVVVSLDHDARQIVAKAKHWGINEVFILGADLFFFMLLHRFNVVVIKHFDIPK